MATNTIRKKKTGTSSARNKTPRSAPMPGRGRTGQNAAAAVGGADDHYAALHTGFRWQVDEYFNIAEACCRRWALADASPSAKARKTAIRIHRPGAGTQLHSYLELQEAADALSHVLRGLGVQRGDRVAIVLPQRFETATAYMAAFQLGAVAVPLSMLFGPEALEYRLQDSEAVVAICDENSVESLQAIRGACVSLHTIVAAGEARGRGDVDYDSALEAERMPFTPVQTRADDPAILIYTSGTTGQPKGALLAHRCVMGNLPGFVCSQNWFGFPTDAGVPAPAPARGRAGVGANTIGAKPRLPQPETQSVFWSPADWAWTGGLMDALLPTLYFGRPIVAYNGRFSPELAFSLMESEAVTHTFLFPTALKAMMKAFPNPRRKFTLKLEGLMSAGEAVGDAVFAYCRDELGVVVNEMFGQTEINYVVGNCARFWPARPGSMGKGYPGHRVAVIDDAGEECAVGVPGDVAVHRLDVHGHPDPILFLGYWKKEAATQAKFTGDWCRTGDMARRDADGYLWYEGRADDVFKAAGYRIGPGEIENCLVKHPAVANAAVVPKPDRDRGALVKAYVVLSADFKAERGAGDATAADFDKRTIAALQAHVKGLLAPYEYPKEIEFIDALPMTTTGKVQRRVLRLQEEARFRALESSQGETPQT